MDAKSKMQFMNSIPNLENETLICPNCNVENEPDNNFCISCGSTLKIFVDESENAPAFSQSEEPGKVEDAAPQHSSPAFATASDLKEDVNSKREEPVKPSPAKKMPEVVYVEAPSAFAEGLPEWSIEPPQVIVRRR